MPKFKMRLKDAFQPSGADLSFFKDGEFNAVNKSSKLFCPATGGLFILENKNTYNILGYESTKNVRFTIYIAILHDKKRPETGLRIDIGANGSVKFIKC
jgi:hypothetical protein